MTDLEGRGERGKCEGGGRRERGRSEGGGRNILLLCDYVRRKVRGSEGERCTCEGEGRRCEEGRMEE